MFLKLEKAEEKYKSLNDQLLKIDISKDFNLQKSIMKELKHLEPIIEKFREYKKINKELEDCKEILSSSEQELKEMAELEIKDLNEKIEKTQEELKILLLPKDPNDDKNVIIEIRGGAGGDEAALFAANLFRMYTMHAQKKRWKIEILNSNETGLGGFKEISFMISGEGAYSEFKFESGVHRVQRVPETESQGRIHTSTVTVAVLPEAEEVEIDINPSDLQIDTYRASGAGGQHVNTTDSAIRITHIPTGVVVECQDERSQHKNRDKAMKVLRSRLLDAKKREQAENMDEKKKSQVGTGDRSERIRTYNFPQNRVTDHRISANFHCLDSILEGNMEKLIEALKIAEKTNLLAENI